MVPTAIPAAVPTMSAMAVKTPIPPPSGHHDPRDGREQQHLQPAGPLIRCPAADQGGRGEPGQDQPELDEDELQEATDGAHVDAREEPVRRLSQY